MKDLDLAELQQAIFSLFTHDLRNEVTKALGFGEIFLKIFALEGFEDEKRTLEMSVKSARKIDAIISIYSKLYGQMNLEQKADITLVVETAFSMLQQDIEALKNQRVEIDYPETVAQVPQLFHAVFYNIIQNSIKHSKQANLVVSVKIIDNKIVIRDNGQGIKDEQKAILFQRGRGLGIVKRILSLTSFDIKETGIPGQGARFEIVSK